MSKCDKKRNTKIHLKPRHKHLKFFSTLISAIVNCIYIKKNASSTKLLTLIRSSYFQQLYFQAFLFFSIRIFSLVIVKNIFIAKLHGILFHNYSRFLTDNSPYSPPGKKPLPVSAISSQFDIKNAKLPRFSAFSKLPVFRCQA